MRFEAIDWVGVVIVTLILVVITAVITGIVMAAKSGAITENVKGPYWGDPQANELYEIRKILERAYPEPVEAK